MNAFLRRSSEKCQSGRMDLIRNQAHERLCRGFESLFLLIKSYNLLVISELWDFFFHERKPRMEKTK